MPPIAITGAMKWCTRIAADLGEDARDGAGGGFREEVVNFSHAGNMNVKSGELALPLWLMAFHAEILESLAFGRLGGVFPCQAQIVEKRTQNFFGNMLHRPASQWGSADGEDG